MKLYEMKAEAAALEATARALAKRILKVAPRYAEKATIIEIVGRSLRGAEFDAGHIPTDKATQLLVDLDAKGESLVEQVVAGCAALVEEKGERLKHDDLKRQINAELQPRAEAIGERAMDNLRRLELQTALAAWREAAEGLRHLADTMGIAPPD